MNLLLLLLISSIFSGIKQGACKEDIYLMGLYPEKGSSSWSLPLGSLTGSLALEHINAREDILPGYNLKVDWKNSNCLDSTTLQSFISFLRESNRTYLGVFGPGCSVSAVAIANLSPLYGLITLTYGAASPSLEDEIRYPFFIRGITSDTNIAAGRINFIHSHGWQRVAIVNQQEEIFVYNSFVIQQALRSLGIMYRTETFDTRSSEVANQISNVISLIRDEGYRIVITNMYETAAVQFICQLRNSGPTPYITWLFIGWYTNDWDANAFEITKGGCTTQEIRDVINGAIGIITYQQFSDILESNATTISGYTPQQLYDMYKDTAISQNYNFEEEKDVIDAYLYDSLWTYALGLNRTIAQGFDPMAFSYDANSSFTHALYQNSYSQEFIGWTGKVSYYRRERIAERVLLLEFINGTTEYRGYYSNLPPDPSEFGNTTGVIANIREFKVWNPALASDGIEDHFAHIGIFASAIVVATLVGIYIMSLIIAILVGVKMDLPPATKSEPFLNIIILSGNYLSLLLAVLFTVDGKFFVNLTHDSATSILFCHSNIWLICVGASVIFGGVLAKASKYYIIVVKNKFKYTHWLHIRYLLLFPLGLILANTIIITIWALIAPITYTSTESPSGVPDPPFYRTYRCSSNSGGVSYGFVVPLAFMNLGLILVGTLLAYHLRKVVNKSQRYSSVIVWTMYTGLAFIAAIGIVIGFVTDVNIRSGLASILTISQAFTTATIIAMPVVYYLIKDPNGTTFFRNANKEDFPEDTGLLKQRIAALERDLSAYKEKELAHASGFKRIYNKMRKATVYDNKSYEHDEKAKQGKRSKTNVF